MNDFMLSTSDNPYNPWTQFDDWYAFDEAKGYHTCSYLARVACCSDALSEADQELAINEAIEEIIQFNVSGKYIKVFEPQAS